MTWIVEFHPLAMDEVEAQPADVRARLQRLTGLIEEHGPAELPPKATKNLRDQLWELRLTGKDGIARAMYVTRQGRRLLILRVFTKKSQKTPPREIRLALQRAEEIS